jgi:hypothetical protein
MKAPLPDPRNLGRASTILAGSLVLFSLLSACSTPPEAARQTPAAIRPSKPLRDKPPRNKPASTPPSTAKFRTPAHGVQSEPEDVQVDAQTRAKMGAGVPTPTKVESEVPNASDVR